METLEQCVLAKNQKTKKILDKCMLQFVTICYNCIMQHLQFSLSCPFFFFPSKPGAFLEPFFTLYSEWKNQCSDAIKISEHFHEAKSQCSLKMVYEYFLWT